MFIKSNMKYNVLIETFCLLKIYHILGPSGKYEIMNEGYIAAFKIACDVIDDEEFKADAKNFAIEGKKLQELYNFCEPEPGVWTKRQNVDQCIDNLINNRNSGGYSRG